MKPIRDVTTETLGPIRLTRSLTGATLGAYANVLRAAAGVAALAAGRLRPREPIELPGRFVETRGTPGAPAPPPGQRRRPRTDAALAAIAAGTVGTVTAQLGDLSSDELARLHDLEMAGRGRESLLDAIEDALLSP